MATGVSTSLGYSIPQVGGMAPRAEFYDSVSRRTPSLMYELNLSSYPPLFYQGKFISPLTVANAPLYSRFGKRVKSVKNVKSITKRMCEKFLESGKKINPLTGKAIKKNGPTYKLLMKNCKLKGVKQSSASKTKRLKASKTKPLSVSGSLDKKVVSKKLNYGDLSIFRGKKPDLPNKRSNFNVKRVKGKGN